MNYNTVLLPCQLKNPIYQQKSGTDPAITKMDNQPSSANRLTLPSMS